MIDLYYANNLRWDVDWSFLEILDTKETRDTAYYNEYDTPRPRERSGF